MGPCLNEFKFLVLNSHQFFFGLVVLVFCTFLVSDLEDLKSKFDVEKRKFIILTLCTLTIGVFIALFTEWGLQGLFFAIEFSLLVTFSLIHPKYAVSFFVYLLLSRPWESYDNQLMSSMPRDISYLTILSVAAHKIIKKQYYFRFNFGTVLLLAFSIWMFLSAFFSNHADLAISNYIEVFSKGVILFILIQNGIESPKDLLPVKAVFVLAILEKCFVSFYKSNMMEVPTLLEEANSRLESVGILSNSNDIAAIFVLAIPFTLLFILKSRLRPIHWMAAITALFAMVYLVWQSQSRGALLGLFAIFGAWTLIKIRSKKILTLVMVFGLVATLGAFSRLQRDASDIEGSTSNRLLYWQAGLNMAIRNPVFGVGFWGFPENLRSYVPDGNMGSEGEHMTAHSSWVLALGEGGFTALFLFVSLWIYAAFAAWKIRLNQPEYFLGLAGYGMTITFLSHTYLLYPYILLALAITHYQLENEVNHNEVTT